MKVYNHLQQVSIPFPVMLENKKNHEQAGLMQYGDPGLSNPESPDIQKDTREEKELLRCPFTLHKTIAVINGDNPVFFDNRRRISS